MSNKGEAAVSLFKEGFCCSQAVFTAFSQELGLDRETALKIGDAFGAGMGGRAETCGAVTGAMMAIGLKYGRTEAGDQDAKDKTRALVSEFFRRFEGRHESRVCKHLLGYDISKPEEMDRAEAEGLFDTLCPKYILSAALILDQIL